MPWASRSWASVLVLRRPAAGAAHIAGGGGSHEDQPRHVDIVRFRRLLGRMIAPDAALVDGGRSVLFGTFLPVYPKIQFDGSAMALRTKAVISSPSRSTAVLRPLLHQPEKGVVRQGEHILLHPVP